MKLTRYVARITMFYHMYVMQFSFSVEKTGSSLVIMVRNGLLTALFAGEDKVIASHIFLVPEKFVDLLLLLHCCLEFILISW